MSTHRSHVLAAPHAPIEWCGNPGAHANSRRPLLEVRRSRFHVERAPGRRRSHPLPFTAMTCARRLRPRTPDGRHPRSARLKHSMLWARPDALFHHDACACRASRSTWNGDLGQSRERTTSARHMQCTPPRRSGHHLHSASGSARGSRSTHPSRSHARRPPPSTCGSSRTSTRPLMPMRPLARRDAQSASMPNPVATTVRMRH